MQRKKKASSLPSGNLHFSRKKQIVYGTNRKLSQWQKFLNSTNPILLSRVPKAALFEKWKHVFSADPLTVPQGFWGGNLGYATHKLRQRCQGIKDPFVPTTSPMEVAFTTEVRHVVSPLSCPTPDPVPSLLLPGFAACLICYTDNFKILSLSQCLSKWYLLLRLLWSFKNDLSHLWTTQNNHPTHPWDWQWLIYTSVTCVFIYWRS